MTADFFGKAILLAMNANLPLDRFAARVLAVDELKDKLFAPLKGGGEYEDSEGSEEEIIMQPDEVPMCWALFGFV